VRAILDEQLSPQIAVLLRQAGYDVDAVVDREDLVERSGRIILEVACSAGRAKVMNNIEDFRPLAAEWLAQGRVHADLILLPSRRARTRGAIAAVASAIEAYFATARTGGTEMSAGSTRCRTCRPRCSACIARQMICPAGNGAGPLSQFLSHSPPPGSVHRRSRVACQRRSRAVANPGERGPALLESVLGATPQEFESPILRHADLQERTGQAPPRLSRHQGLSQFLSTEIAVVPGHRQVSGNQKFAGRRCASCEAPCRRPAAPGRPAQPGQGRIAAPDTRQLTDRITLSDREALGECAPSRLTCIGRRCKWFSGELYGASCPSLGVPESASCP